MNSTCVLVLCTDALVMSWSSGEKETAVPKQEASGKHKRGLIFDTDTLRALMSARTKSTSSIMERRSAGLVICGIIDRATHKDS